MYANDVSGILHVLSAEMMEPPRGGYKPMPMGSSEYMHCTTNGMKKAFDQNNNMCNSTDPNARVFNEDDWPRMRPRGEKYMMHVVEIERPAGRNGKWKVHFAPWAIEKFRETILLDAFEKATMSPTFPKQKMITGWTHHDDPSVFQTFDYSKGNFVERYSASLAAAEDRPNGCTRMDGITFPRHEYITTDQATLLFDDPLVHETDTEKQKNRYATEKDRRSVPFVLVNDLERYSTLSQHVRCGQPLDEPLQTPTYVKQKYVEACGGVREHKGMNYPLSLLKSQRKNMSKKRSATSYATDLNAYKASGADMLAQERSMEPNYEEEDEEEEEVEPPAKRIHLGDKGKGEEDDYDYDDDDLYDGDQSPQVTVYQDLLANDDTNI